MTSKTASQFGVWRLRGNIIRTALCLIVWHNVQSQQHTYMSSSYRSSRLGLSHWDPYTMCRGGCLELYYCNMVEWFWWDSSLISRTSWFNRLWNDLWCGTLSNQPAIVVDRLFFVAFLYSASEKYENDFSRDDRLNWILAIHRICQSNLSPAHI